MRILNNTGLDDFVEKYKIINIEHDFQELFWRAVAELEMKNLLEFDDGDALFTN